MNISNNCFSGIMHNTFNDIFYLITILFWFLMARKAPLADEVRTILDLVLFLSLVFLIIKYSLLLHQHWKKRRESLPKRNAGDH